MQLGKVKICSLGLFFIMWCSSCTTLTTYYYSFSLHNDGASDVYQPLILNEKDEWVYQTTDPNSPFLPREYSGLHTANLSSTLKYLKVRWKKAPDGNWIEKRIDVRSGVPKNFWGAVYVSILPNDKLALSWIMKREHANGQGSEDCGGYIFEHYYDEETKASIEENMQELSAYRDQKAKDLQAGLVDKYRTPKYLDTATEADFRCNIYFYL